MLEMIDKIPKEQRALVLQGGGGLGAYELGALKAIVEHAVQNDKKADGNFFNVVAGSSIGAINGAILVGEFVKERSWSRAVQELESFWLEQIATNASFVDNLPGFTEWWKFWFNLGNGSIIGSEAARRYYSSLQFWLFGIPDLVLSSTQFDNRFLNPTFDFLQRSDWSPLGRKLENYKQEKGFRLFPIKTDLDKEEPRLLTTAIDVQTGSGIIFDSYSDEVSYPVPKEENDQNNYKANMIKIKYPGGLRREHIMASARIPADFNFAVVRDEHLNPHMYWDGAFASNTPLRGLIQSHRDWYLDPKHGGIVPDLEEIYVVGLWPRTVKDDLFPVSPDNNFVWSRMWDLLFDDKTTYVEKTTEMITDYLDIIEKLLPLAEENGHKKEIDKFLASFAHSKHRDGNHRKREELLKGRFKIGKIHRIEMSAFQDAAGLKIFDFSKNTVEQLIAQGHEEAMAYLLSKSFSQQNDLGYSDKSNQKASITG